MSYFQQVGLQLVKRYKLEQLKWNSDLERMTAQLLQWSVPEDDLVLLLAEGGGLVLAEHHMDTFVEAGETLFRLIYFVFFRYLFLHRVFSHFVDASFNIFFRILNSSFGEWE